MVKAHILIVEDSLTLAEGIQMILEAAGYQAETGISSGEEALERLKQNQPDLILMDLKLSGQLDGVDTAFAIKQRYDIPVVFLTGHGDQATWQRARDINPHGFLMKPFNGRDLQHVVELAMYMHRTEQNLREREAYYRSLFEDAHDAILIYSPEDQVVLDVNQRACQIYGYSRDEFIGMSLASISLDDSSSPDPTQQLFPGQDSTPAFLVNQTCKDGRRITLEVHASLIPYRGQKAILSINRDVTRRIEEEKELEHYRRQLEELVQERTAELKVANEQLRVQITALASAANGIIITDRDGVIVWSNPAFSQLTGCSSQELLGNRPNLLSSGAQSDDPYAGLWNTALSGRTPRGELTHQRKDGSQYVAETIITPVRNDAGEICNFVAIYHDITERIRTEQALRESEHRYRQMLETSPLIIAMFNGEQISYINPAGARLLGVEKVEAVIGKSISDFIERTNYEQITNIFANFVENDFSLNVSHVIPFVNAQGEMLYLEVSLAYISRSEPVVLQAIVQDVTERRRAQENLRRQAALAEIELAIHQPSELAGVLNKVVEVVTRTLEDSLGASVLYVDRRTGNLLVGGSNLSAAERNQISSGQIKQNKISRWILEHKQPFIITDTHQRVLGTDLLVTNNRVRAYAGVPLITDEQAIGVLYVMDERPREYTRDDIEFLTALANRTALAIAKVEVFQSLQEAKDAAEEATRVKSAFLANMSHELRTPLTSIISLSELLADSPLSHQQTDFVHIIQSSAERLLQLIGNVLDFSRLEASRYSLNQRIFDIRQVIDDALDMLALRAAQKDLQIVCQVDSRVPAYVIGDDGRLAQVLTNLVNNAIKFTDHGYITMSVDVAAEDMKSTAQAPLDGEVVLRFSVEDTGMGIPPDLHTQLFQAFRQLDSSSSRRHGGSGLGLAISKQLVELMGGEIHLHSSGVPGEGSRFTFTVRALAVSDRSLPYLDSNQPLLAAQTVIVLDSLPASRLSLVEKLCCWQMQVAAVESFSQALEWLESGSSPQLAFLSAADLEQADPEDSEKLRQIFVERGIVSIVCLNAGRALASRWGLQYELKLPVTSARLYQTLLRALQPIGTTTAQDSFTSDHASIERRERAILLVDDNPVNSRVLSIIMQNMGYPVDTAANGMLALHAMEEKSYPIVIMDQQMPEMDGLTAIRYIRQVLDPHEQPFILALSADARPETLQSLREAGAQVALSKPVLRGDLANALAQAQHDTSRLTQAGLPASQQAATINLEHLSDLFESLGQDAVEMHAQVLELFLENGPPLMERIEQLAADQAIEPLQTSLHSLKGSCELYGAERLAYLCKSLERDLRTEIAIELPVRVSEIRQEHDAVHLALTELKPGEVIPGETRPGNAGQSAGGIAGLPVAEVEKKRYGN